MLGSTSRFDYIYYIYIHFLECRRRRCDGPSKFTDFIDSQAALSAPGLSSSLSFGFPISPVSASIRLGDPCLQSISILHLCVADKVFKYPERFESFRRCSFARGGY